MNAATDFEMSESQAKEFARAIVGEIRDFIKNHEAGFQQFLIDEAKNIEEEGGKNGKSRKFSD